MLVQLLESNPRQARSFGGTVVSTIGHTVVIAAAVFATAQARVDEPASREVIRWVNPKALSPTPSPARASAVERSAIAPLPDIRVLDRIDVAAAPIDLLGTVSIEPVPAGGFTRASVTPAGQPGGGEVSEAFVADQVERQASLRSGSPPRYPNVLRSAGVEGEVVVSFVVGVNGWAELSTLRVVRSDNALFEAAVRQALTAMQFDAAEIGGRKVRQLVQMPFVFRITR